MQPNDREDSSNYAQPHPDAPEPVVVQPEPSKPKKSKAPLVLSLLLLFAIAAALSMGWLWFQQSGRVDNLEADLSSSRNNVARLESAAKVEAKLDDQATITEEKGMSDSELIISTVSAYAHGQSATSKVTVTIKKLQPPFAAASYTDSSVMVSGGGLCVLKEADDIWMVLYCAQADSEYTQMLDKTFSVPASIKAS